MRRALLVVLVLVMPGAAIGALGFYAWRWWKKRRSSAPAAAAPEEQPEELPEPEPEPAVLKTQMVQHRERAAGVDARLMAFLDWWEKSPTVPFPIAVGWRGGVRTNAQQAELYAEGRRGIVGEPIVTNAKTVEQSAHGHAAALDLYPVIDGKVRGTTQADSTPEVFAYLQQIGEIAEEHGFTWGGRWKKPDRPHIETKDWKELPLATDAAANVA